jgi:hypothetical protein
MKAEELRLGNWVNPNFPMQVTCIYKDEILCDFEGNEGDMWEFDPKDLNGIPLTEEWLKKFGFEKDGPHWYWFSTKDRFTDIGYSYSIEEEVIEFHDLKVPIKYVHQLQNLYFALTGKEL